MLVWLAFAFTLLIQLYFYLYIFRKFARSGHGDKHPVETLPGVSVVVAARNESENLSRNLGFLEQQVYRDYEIILVDDGSSDLTFEILAKFKKEHSNAIRPIHLVRIEAAGSRGKKQALARGIERAAKEIILVTDADCLPSSTRWIEIMASGFGRNRELQIMLGYGAYSKVPGSFLNRLIRYETLLTAVQYFSYALNGNPYMGVGRNLAYTKRLFTSTGGFAKHQDLRSGDDDLFVSEAAGKTNTGICADPDAFTISEPKRTLSSWIRQKRRHITTANRYRSSQQARLVLFYLSQLGFYLLAVALFLTTANFTLLCFLILLRFSAYYFAIGPSAKRLGEKDLLAFAPLYEISIIFMQLYLFMYNKLSPPKHW